MYASIVVGTDGSSSAATHDRDPWRSCCDVDVCAWHGGKHRGVGDVASPAAIVDL